MMKGSFPGPPPGPGAGYVPARVRSWCRSAAGPAAGDLSLSESTSKDRSTARFIPSPGLSWERILIPTMFQLSLGTVPVSLRIALWDIGMSCCPPGGVGSGLGSGRCGSSGCGPGSATTRKPARGLRARVPTNPGGNNLGTTPAWVTPTRGPDTTSHERAHIRTKSVTDDDRPPDRS